MAKSDLPELLSPQESAILLLRLIELRETDGHAATRVRVSELTLRRMWGRVNIDDHFLGEVREWLFRAGWVLFSAGSTYAAIKTATVLSWSRASSKRMSSELEQVQKGRFNFQDHIEKLSNTHAEPSDD